MNERCGKFGYATEAAARVQLKEQKKDKRSGNKKLRTRLEVYLCPMHNVETWHIGHNAFATSRSRRFERHAK